MGLSIQNHSTQYNIIKFPHGERMFDEASIVAEIPARWRTNPSYMHSFAMTDNYFIVIEQPLGISMIESLKAKYFKRPLASIFKWFQKECTLFHLIDRCDDKKIRYTFKSSSFFYLHTINAYEDGGNVVIDICSYNDPSVLDCMYIEAMENMQFMENYAKMFRSRPLRFILPVGRMRGHFIPKLSLWNRFIGRLSQLFTTSAQALLQREQNTGGIMDTMGNNKIFWKDFEARYAVENLVDLKNSQCRAYFTDSLNIFCVPERLCDLGCETPRINDREFSGKIYRFFYAISSDVDSKVPGTVRT